MPALNFQRRFAALVESGEKRQTIRAYRKDGRDPKPGDRLYLYTGMRTKECRKLGEATCSAVEPFDLFVTPSGGLFWLLGHEAMTGEECDDLARRDGFVGSFELMGWFEKTHGLPFEGLLIRWGELSR